MAQPHGPADGASESLLDFADAAAKLLTRPGEARDTLITGLQELHDVLKRARVEQPDQLPGDNATVDLLVQARTRLEWALRQSRFAEAVTTPASTALDPAGNERLTPPNTTEPSTHRSAALDPAGHKQLAPPDSAESLTAPESPPATKDAARSAQADPQDAETTVTPHPTAADNSALRREEFHRALEELESELPSRTGSGLGSRPARAVPPTETAELWRRLHLDLLTRPGSEHTYWAGRLALAAQSILDCGVDQGDDSVVPALEAIGADRVDVPLTLPGWESLPEATRRQVKELFPDVTDVPGDSLVLLWAARAEQGVRMLELDPDLGGYIGDSRTWNAWAVDDFKRRCSQQLNSLSAVLGRGTVQDRLLTAHRLDELLGRLCHCSPAQRGSWWWSWRLAVSGQLAEFAAGASLAPPSDDTLATWGNQEVALWCDKNIEGDPHGELIQWVLRTPLLPLGSEQRSGSRVAAHRGRILTHRSKW